MGHFDAVSRMDGRAAVERALHPAGVPRLVGPRSPGADPQRMRGIPVIGIGVGGAIPGTFPRVGSRGGSRRGDRLMRPPEVMLPPTRCYDRDVLEQMLGDQGIAAIDGLTVLRSRDTVTIQRMEETELAHAARHRCRVRERYGHQVLRLAA